jgi:hypothetical protein
VAAILEDSESWTGEHRKIIQLYAGRSNTREVSAKVHVSVPEFYCGQTDPRLD